MINEEIIEIFKDKNDYDDIDEKTFQSECFQEQLNHHLIESTEYDSEEEYLSDAMRTVIEALNYCQYGDTSDSEDNARMLEDLNERGLWERVL